MDLRLESWRGTAHHACMQTAPVAPLLVSEAARVLNVSAETVRNLERAGRLPAVRTANGVRVFDRRQVEALARERAAEKR